MENAVAATGAAWEAAASPAAASARRMARMVTSEGERLACKPPPASEASGHRSLRRRGREVHRSIHAPFRSFSRSLEAQVRDAHEPVGNRPQTLELARVRP